MLKYRPFIKKIQEINNFADYKEEIAKKVISQQDKTIPPTTDKEPEKNKDEIKTDANITDSIKKEIESLEIKKGDIKTKMDKIEELIASGDFSDDNKKNLETEKQKLIVQMTEFDNMIKTSTNNLKNLQDSNKK